MFLTVLPTVITSIWVSTSERVTICARKVAAPQNSSLTRFAPRLTTRLTRLQHTARTEQRLDRTATSTCSLTTPQDSRGEMKVGRSRRWCFCIAIPPGFLFGIWDDQNTCVLTGMVTGEDYEEVRHNRGGRGRPHGGQKSWRYSRWV